MAKRNTPQPPTTAGYAWGPERVRLGLSLRALKALTNVPISYLSMAESGRYLPTSQEYDAVTAALAKVRLEKGETA